MHVLLWEIEQETFNFVGYVREMWREKKKVAGRLLQIQMECKGLIRA